MVVCRLGVVQTCKGVVVFKCHTSVGLYQRTAAPERAGYLQPEALNLLLQGSFAELQLLQLTVLFPLGESQREELLFQGATLGHALSEPLLESTKRTE